MIKITKQQRDARWDVLPLNLREVLCSPEQGTVIWNICKENHLSEEKTAKIAELAGLTVMGFIHPEDLGKEIKQAIDINQEIADSIVKEINRKIFYPIKSDLEGVYGIPTEEEIIDKELGVSEEPEHVIDLRINPEENGESEKNKAKMEIVKTPKIVEEASKIGDGRTEWATGGELVDLRTFEKVGGEATPKSEFKIAGEPAGGKESAVLKSDFEAPMIIHEEKKLRPISDAKRSLGGLFGFLKADSKSAIEPPKPKSVAAEISLDKTKEEIEPKAAQTEPPKARVVHYSQFKTSLSSPFEEGKAGENQLAKEKLDGGLKAANGGNEPENQKEYPVGNPEPPINLPTLQKEPSPPPLSSPSSGEDVIDLRNFKREQL